MKGGRVSRRLLLLLLLVVAVVVDDGEGDIFGPIPSNRVLEMVVGKIEMA